MALKRFDPIPERAGTLVVGAGVAGLVAAARLARAGDDVVVLEANHQVGGLATSIERRGFTFDVGTQSLESIGLLFPILEQLGLPGRDGFHRGRHRLVGPVEQGGGQRTFAFDFGLDDWDTLAAHWKEAEGLRPERVDAFVSRVRPVQEALDHLASRPPPWITGRFDGGDARHLGGLLLRAPTLLSALTVDTEALCRRLFGDHPVGRWLGFAGYSNANLLSLAGFYAAWFDDYWYPRGGMGVWTKQLRAAAEQAGARFATQARVTELELQGGRVVAADVARGSRGPTERIACDRVLWAGAPQPLYRDVLSEHPGVGGAFARRALQAEPSDAMLSVYVGLDLPLEQLRARLQRSHVYHFPDEAIPRVRDHLDDPEAHARTWVQLCAPNLHEPGHAPEGQSALVIQCFSDARWMDRWATAGRGDRARPAAHRRLKEAVGDQLVRVASAVVPELAERIVYRDVGSPLSLTRFTGNPDGSTVGWHFHPRRGPLGALPVRTSGGLPNLYVAGHWYVNPGGVPFAAHSGWLTSSRML